MNTPFVLDFPDDYPELLEQMGQIIGRKLVEQGFVHEQAKTTAFQIVEAIRTELGGVQQYIPRGLGYELSKRDEEIYKEFDGKNYHRLAHKFHLTEMQVRNIVKRGIASDRAKRQGTLL